jgi:polyribonucleotide nucleotidyltransferase
MIEKLKVVKNEESFDWWDKKITFQNWFLAPQAEWNIVVKFDWIEFLATATINKNPDPNKDFLPLMVDFREMFYSSWKIGGAPYRRKEWKPSDEAVLISRLIDRSIRPLFPSGMINDVVLTITTLQIDRKNLYWVPGIIASSLAIMMAWIEFEWPIWAVRIGYKDGKYIINPTKDELGMMNLVIAGTKDTITMIESGWENIPEEVLINAIDLAQKEIKFICEKQEEFVKKYNKKHNEATIMQVNDELIEQAQKLANDYEEKFFPTNKEEFQKLYNEIIEKLTEKYEDNEQINSTMINQAVFKAVKKVLRTHLLKTWNRLDGRNPLQVRPLYTEVGLLEKVHGSWLFQRWETQILSLTTLWAPWKVLLQDTLEKDDEEERFMHHYYMLPFSTNEARWYRGQGRREIGHWFLAEKTLRPILPDEKDFPYTIRIASEALSSSGSTSMASVCAGCLSLMDAGVPIKEPVSGIAMWLVIEKLTNEQVEKYTKNNPYLKIIEIDGEKYGYIILTDLQWQEDFTWDMDFKIAWPKNGINALQLDMKVKWLPTFVLQQAIQQWMQAKKEILEFMLETISEPRKEVSPYAPSLTTLKLTPDNVRTIIWKWWETIKDIIEQTWVAIDFEDDGTTIITANNAGDAQKAINMIMDLIWEPKKWEKIKWKITRVESYGVFVDLWKWKTGLAHVRSFKEYIEDLTKKFKVGDELEVEISDIGKDGKIQIKPVEN